jgi:hypothetical protein
MQVMPLFSAFMSCDGQFISTYARTTKRSRQICLAFNRPRTRLALYVEDLKQNNNNKKNNNWNKTMKMEGIYEEK